MLLDQQRSCQFELNEISLRSLANLGDAVDALFKRELALHHTKSAERMHHFVKERVNAKAQANHLDLLLQHLNNLELDIVRRARNLKTAKYRKNEQTLHRKATAYEVLLGYLYLSNNNRLKELLGLIAEA